MSGAALHGLRDVWAHNLEKFADKTAAICEGAAYSYAECDRLSDRLRRAFAERFAFKKGDTIAVAGPNCLESFITFWAAMKSGGVVVPVNTRLGPPEIEHVLNQSDAQILVVHKANWRSIKDAIPAAPRIKHLVAVGFDAPDATPWESLVAEGEPWDYHPDIAEEDLAIIMHTSGTTGRPKGAMMRHGDLLFNNKLAVHAHGLRHEDVHLLVLPIFHATTLYSLIPTSALLGSTVVPAPRPEMGPAMELIQAHRCTTFFGVPTLFRLLTTLKGLEKYDLSSLRLIAYAGSPMPAAVIKRLRELFPNAKLHNFFGLTETISMTHVLPDGDADTRPDSIGKLLPHVRQRILDEHGNNVQPGEVGELHFHRANIICGYWKEPERLEESIQGEWFNTGDLATMDADGYVTIKGRSKEMIIVGGENVYALEVESCIQTHDDVLDVAVVGVPATGFRAYLGELVKAVIVPKPGADLSPPQIKRHCMERLAGYKVPQIVGFRDELPRNSAGKLLKRLLK